jgi:hypothetical protein
MIHTELAMIEFIDNITAVIELGEFTMGIFLDWIHYCNKLV